MPAIHLTREDVGATFHEHLGTPAGDSDPDRLTAAARVHLRERFLGAQAAITEPDLAVAESGAFVVVTNEGNADLGMSIAPIHIACCGIEKLIPRAEDLGVFLRLLARSATGQTLSVYSSHVRAPRPGQARCTLCSSTGAALQLGRPEFWRSLKCIRCAACLNTCPVYRRSGGHSYGSTVAGPIRSVLTPGFDLHKYAELPFASTLCGSCAAVCPVKVDLDRQLLHWRQQVTAAGLTSIRKRASATIGGWVLRSPRAYTALGNAARALLRLVGPARARAWSGAWGNGRGVPEPPRSHSARGMRHARPKAAATRGRGERVNAKAAILTAVQAARPSAIPLAVDSETRAFSAGGGDGTRFRAAAAATGATVVECDRRQLGETTAKAMQGVTHVVSHVPDVPGTMDPPSAPRAYAGVGGFVCEAELGVAENGAVWLTASRLGCRAGLFLATDVVIVLASDAIVANMRGLSEDRPDGEHLRYFRRWPVEDGGHRAGHGGGGARTSARDAGDHVAREVWVNPRQVLKRLLHLQSKSSITQSREASPTARLDFETLPGRRSRSSEMAVTARRCSSRRFVAASFTRPPSSHGPIGIRRFWRRAHSLAGREGIRILSFGTARRAKKCSRCGATSRRPASLAPRSTPEALQSAARAPWTRASRLSNPRRKMCATPDPSTPSSAWPSCSETHTRSSRKASQTLAARNHFARFDEQVSEFARLLAPGGVLVIRIPGTSLFRRDVCRELQAARGSARA
ncbi:MAG: LUD domain-containing protein [Gemmatimonadaceae bacterium]